MCVRGKEIHFWEWAGVITGPAYLKSVQRAGGLDT